MTKSLAKIRRTKKKLNYDYPVVVATKTNQHIYAQVLEAKTKKIVFSASSKNIKKGTKKEKSQIVGKRIGDYLNSKKIDKIVFDRNGNLYHGRIAELAEGIKNSKIEI